MAVKTLSSTDEHDIEKFLEEAELMKKFCHPNIISLLGVNCVYSEGAPLMILEYMSYGDLQGFLTKHRYPLTLVAFSLFGFSSADRRRTMSV